MKWIKQVAVLIACLGLYLQGEAQFRKYSNEFLNIGAGARSLGMGGSAVSSTSDATSGYWNPAGLADIRDNPQLNLMHAEYFSGIGKYDFAGLAIPLKNNRSSLGISFLRFGIDDIPNTIFLIEPGGRPNYNNIETFSSADYALLLSLASQKNILENRQLSYGGSIKIIHRNVGHFAKAWGFGIDAALRYKTGNWSLGVVLRDGTTTYNMWNFTFTDREKEVLYATNNDIPVKSYELTQPRLILGAGHRFHFNRKISLLAEIQLDNTFDGRRNTIIATEFMSIDPRLGIELNVNDVFFVRGGISNFQQALKDGDVTNSEKTWIFQPAAGAGFKVGNLKIDYAFTNLANQSSPLYTHIVSLGVDLKKKTNPGSPIQ